MRKLFTLCFSIAMVGLLNACAQSNHVDHSAKNQFVTEFYAWVESVEKVRFKSYVGEGAAVGAVDGLLHNVHGNSEDMLAGVIVGGVFGGLITALFEGNTVGYEYELEAVDGDLVSVIVEKKAAAVGQCVRVRVAGDVRIRLVQEAQCYEAAKAYPDI